MRSRLVVHVVANDEISVGAKERVKVLGRVGPGKTGRTHELIRGEEAIKSTGGWAQKVRLIDWARDWYLEMVYDPEGRSLPRYENGRLSDHQGHGSARLKTKR